MLHAQPGHGGQKENRAAPAPDEVVLLKGVADGDRDAFEVLYRCYHPRLTRFLERVTRRPQMVEEVLDDTMLVVWRKAQTYNHRSKVSTWIFGIAVRKAMKALKRVDDAIDSGAEEQEIEAKSGPEGELQQRQLRAMLGHAMSALSAEQRAVVELTYYEGYAYGEIAEIMACPVDTVKTRMFHARRRLKALLTSRVEVAG
jgi:RNA polymerase sigma-70 factor (ECF subfamily)